jgi:hypothetical protein
MKIKLALKILAKPDDETVVKMWKSEVDPNYWTTGGQN